LEKKKSCCIQKKLNRREKDLNNETISQITATAIQAGGTRFLAFVIHIHHIQQPLSAYNATLVGYRPTNKRFIFNNRY